MSNTKVIVVVGVSKKSWEDAVRQVVAKASESVGQISRIDVVHQWAKVQQDEVSEFHATVHVTFELEEDGSTAEPADTTGSS